MNKFFLFHSEILVSMFGFHITRGEMKSLTGKQWVNSVVKLFVINMCISENRVYDFFNKKLACIWIDTIGNWHDMSCAK